MLDFFSQYPLVGACFFFCLTPAGIFAAGWGCHAYIAKRGGLPRVSWPDNDI